MDRAASAASAWRSSGWGVPSELGGERALNRVGGWGCGCVKQALGLQVAM
jgi:hypothetical protein